MDGRYQNMVEALQAPVAYALEGVELRAPVEVVETHVSHLFMTEDLVYKIKKPVDLGFIDLTTLERRRANCEAELTLNRRLSPDVYLAVLPVVERDGVISFGGGGEVMEYAVKMRRLPRERMLDVLLASDHVGYEDVERVARNVAAFHKSAEASEEITRRGGFENLRRLVLGNLREIEALESGLFSRPGMALIKAYSRMFLVEREATFRKREAQGYIRDGHGDLHAAHVCLDDELSIIDCLEFSADYRYGDTALDAAFLAMDLDYFRRDDLALAFTEQYMKSARDKGSRELMTFYKCYRAMVRAKIGAIRWETADADDGEGRAVAERDAKAYFRLAARYAMSSLPRYTLLVVMGLPGVGKSTLARALTDGRRISSDFERKRQVGLLPDQHNYVPYGTGMYGAEADRRTYEVVIEKATVPFRGMMQGMRVVDASFRDPAYRDQIVREASASGIDVWFIEATAAPDVVRGRIAGRVERGDDASDATWEIYERARADWVSVSEVFASRHLVVDTDHPIQDAVDEVLDSLFMDGLRRGPADGWATWAARASLEERKHRRRPRS
jgi:uncharacterized protein